MVYESEFVVISALTLLLVIGYPTYLQFTEKAGIPDCVPWAGPKSGFFSGVRNRLASINGFLEMIEDGYRKVR
jgi:hypothetical protein